MAILKKMDLFDHVNYSCNPMVEVDGAYHRIESTWIRRVNEFTARPDIDITKVKYTIDILMSCYSKKPEKGHLQLAQRNWHSVPLDDVVACSAACSTGALKFGDINNKESEVYKRKKDERVYHLLEYVGTKPNVFYHTKVRNIDKSI